MSVCLYAWNFRDPAKTIRATMIKFGHMVRLVPSNVHTKQESPPIGEAVRSATTHILERLRLQVGLLGGHQTIPAKAAINYWTSVWLFHLLPTGNSWRRRSWLWCKGCYVMVNSEVATCSNFRDNREKIRTLKLAVVPVTIMLFVADRK